MQTLLITIQGHGQERARFCLPDIQRFYTAVSVCGVCSPIRFALSGQLAPFPLLDVESHFAICRLKFALMGTTLPPIP